MTPEETINKVTCNLFPGCIDEVAYEPTKKAREEINSQKKPVDINDPAAEFITVESVSAAFKSFGKFKGSGSDSLKPLLLQNLGISTLTRIVAVSI